ncbi:MAG: hypothetical protein A3G91_01565 [Omnitrophica WOR_2 bacterium RIFCSPLOWO2_12_FULL_50_9]|nr:MAG: hypothetical protein A3D87_08480 [Omnitrophica WOR_2 bacterium RIFCSPHIGHO2_02_FULL_50_17]OGX40282.1 MAG: hypothetical protein A3G91_01565 [Omnitrophica WOR_2 bacterium RIFCSPLOWO2_12_FULL_50_9]
MLQRRPLAQREKDLTRRYLVWCYKTTKEELDKIDRYFTQAMVDNFLILQLTNLEGYKSSPDDAPLRKAVDEFIGYARGKKAKAEERKFADIAQSALQPGYQYLKVRFKAVEQAIVQFLGRQELDKIRGLYEEEMTSRILQAREHA